MAIEKGNTASVSMINGDCVSSGALKGLQMLKLWTTTERGLLVKKIKPVSPGEMLEEEFLKPYGLTKYRLAKEIGVPPQRIGDIVAGKRAITADTDLRLCRYFGLSDGWWLRGQMEYDMAMTKAKMLSILAAIRPRDLSPV